MSADALVCGEEAAGYRAAMTSLARGRVHIAALAVGTAQRALDESVTYAAHTKQGSDRIGDFQLVQAMLADMQTGVLAGRAMVRETARAYVSGEDRRIVPSATKLFCTEMVGKVADLAVQVHGGAGSRHRDPRDDRQLRDITCTHAAQVPFPAIFELEQLRAALPRRDQGPPPP